uniref:PGG domain-containing protein n=1 Tax=Solanum lycopersicum TaxID=4081 RepID=A0A3Q7JD78_SOLLC
MASEIQKHSSGQGMGRTSSQELREKEKEVKDKIFQAAMANKWRTVKHLYTDKEFVQFVHELKLTRSEETALHLAITAYHPDRDDSLQHPHFTCIKEMIDDIPEENRLRTLKLKNDKGNTPLHLAAELGSVKIIECLVNPSDSDLIRETNSKGETPLFVAAYRGKLKAFLYLQKCCVNQKERGIDLCRRKDGDNILHAAISGEYFDLAFQIIHHYGQLVNYYNAEGMSPLHFLSRMPQVFKSGSHFRSIDSIIYYCTNIEELELMTYKAKDKEDSHSKLKWNLPENYQTMVEFFELLWNGTLKTLRYLNRTYFGNRLYFGNQEDPSKNTTGATNENQGKKSQDTTGATNENQGKKSQDTTGATNDNQGKKSQGHQNNQQYDVENPPIQAERKRSRKLFPDNYTIFIEFLKCIMKILLIVLGIGLQRTKKLEERKKQHTWGVQIMKLMIEKEERYKSYESTGGEPEDRPNNQIGAPPPAPPSDVENEDSNTAQIEQPPTSSTDKKIDDLKSDRSKTKETPLLVASKMGIVEMHRQTNVYNWLTGEKYPEYVFYHVDNHGNNAVHLAAMYQKLEVWRIPGSALQLQGERKWYKYVKHTLPRQSYVRYNNKGQTPRQIFIETHANLLSDGTQWLVTTANSFSLVAALIATVAFATSSTIPGGADDNGHPHLKNQPAFDVFSVTSLISLCFSVTALVFFLAILTSRCRHNDFEKDLPRKLLLGLTSLFASITAILISFCAAHFFVLRDKYRNAAIPIYGATCIPVVFFAFNQFPLYVDLIRSYIQKLPLRSYKVFYTDSSEAT